MFKKKYLIFAPSYNENSGGTVVLHKLCHLINHAGYEAVLYPFFVNYDINNHNFFKKNWDIIKKEIKYFFRKYKCNTAFNTPVLTDINTIDLDEYIVVYPEMVFGNPLNAKNVVRWLLHQPGHHTGKIFYSKNELYFKFNSAIDDFVFPGSCTSVNELKVIHYPLEYYFPPNNEKTRCGTAYCIRKGKDKKIIHDLNNSICIDNMSHKEIGEIFRKVDTFISYDVYTAYSVFAVLCGANSIVIPDRNMSIDDWYPNHDDRNGIAYGFSKEEFARAFETRSKVRDYVVKEESKSLDNVKSFIFESQDFFISL